MFSILRNGNLRSLFFGIFFSVFSWSSSETFAPPKVSNTSKGGSRRGKGGRIAFLLPHFLLPHFPLLENPPLFDPPRRIIPFARSPQNRSGIRNSLTRSDLVLGRLLVQRFTNFTYLSNTIIQARLSPLATQSVYGQPFLPIGIPTALRRSSHSLDACLQRSPNRLIHCH